MKSVFRSFVFDCIFYLFTAVYLSVFFPLVIILPRGFSKKLYQLWTKSILYFMKRILNLNVSIKGLEHIKKAAENGPVIFAFQHQSAVDTILPSLLFNDFSIVLKKELSFIPVFSSYLKKLECIFIDRKNGSDSMKRLMKEAKKQYLLGRHILIYPQGKRALPTEQVKCHPGIFAIYSRLGCPVIPILINSGNFWPRRAVLKYSGTINVQIMPPIPQGLDRERLLSILDSLFAPENNINKQKDITPEENASLIEVCK